MPEATDSCPWLKRWLVYKLLQKKPYCEVELYSSPWTDANCELALISTTSDGKRSGTTLGVDGASLLFCLGLLTTCRVFSSISTSPANALRPVEHRIFRLGHAFLYLPFLITDRLITAKDHASVQISIADVDAEGKILPTSTSFAVCGQVRALGESDDSLNRLATKEGCRCL